MIVIDSIGNTLALNDLVMYHDERGTAHLCVVSAVFEKPQALQLCPLPLTVPFEGSQVRQVIKVVKPASAQRQKAS